MGTSFSAGPATRDEWFHHGRPCEAGDVLFTEGDPAHQGYLLQEGRIRLIKRVGAGERTLRILRPGDLLGEGALTEGASHNSTAVCLETGRVLVLDRARLREILEQDPGVFTRILDQLVQRLRDAEDQVEVLMVRNAQSKLVLALLKLAQQARGSGSDPEPVRLRLSPLELSARVGLDVDTVKRIIGLLRQNDYLRIVDEQVEIPNLGALRDLLRLLDLSEQVLGGRGTVPTPTGVGGTRVSV